MTAGYCFERDISYQKTQKLMTHFHVPKNPGSYLKQTVKKVEIQRQDLLKNFRCWEVFLDMKYKGVGDYNLPKITSDLTR